MRTSSRIGICYFGQLIASFKSRGSRRTRSLPCLSTATKLLIHGVGSSTRFMTSLLSSSSIFPWAFPPRTLKLALVHAVLDGQQNELQCDIHPSNTRGHQKHVHIHWWLVALDCGHQPPGWSDYCNHVACTLSASSVPIFLAARSWLRLFSAIREHNSHRPLAV